MSTLQETEETVKDGIKYILKTSHKFVVLNLVHIYNDMYFRLIL